MERRCVPTCTIFPLFFTAAQNAARIGHGVRGWLFHVGVAACFHGLGAVISVLEIGGGNDDGVYVLARIQFVVIAHRIGTIARELLNEIDALFAAHLPDIGNGHDLEVHVLGILLEGGQIAAFHAVAAAHNSHADAIVRAHDLGVAFGIERDGGCGQRCAACFQEFPAIVLDCCHGAELLGRSVGMV